MGLALAGSVDGHLSNIESKYANVQGVQADFVQETTNVLLKQPYVQEGKVYISKPSLLHWEFQKPMEQHYYADTSKITIWTPSQNQAIISSNQERSQGLTSILTNLSDLKNQYNIELLSEANDVVQLKLSSNEQEGSIQLWFSSKDYVLQQVLVDTNNAQTKVMFKEMQLNPTFEEGEFVFVPSEGTDIQDAR
jgi:chaperone LolA